MFFLCWSGGVCILFVGFVAFVMFWSVCCLSFFVGCLRVVGCVVVVLCAFVRCCFFCVFAVPLSICSDMSAVGVCRPCRSLLCFGFGFWPFE